MKSREIRQMTRAEIEEQLAGSEGELANLQLQLATHQLENPLVIRQVRRDVARMKTVLRELELGLTNLPGESETATSVGEQKEN